jgi:hypothetical protein
MYKKNHIKYKELGDRNLLYKEIHTNYIKRIKLKSIAECLRILCNNCVMNNREINLNTVKYLVLI